MWNPRSWLPCLAFVSLLVPIAAQAQPEVWTIDPGHSAATFQVRHMVVANVKGEATIDARTINTRNSDRDKDLRSNLFFDVGKYPKITFKSRSVAGVDPASVMDFEKWIGEREGLAKQTRLMAVTSRPAGW